MCFDITGDLFRAILLSRWLLMSLDVCILVFVYDCSVSKKDIALLIFICHSDLVPVWHEIIRVVFKKRKTQFACIMQIIAYYYQRL